VLGRPAVPAGASKIPERGAAGSTTAAGSRRGATMQDLTQGRFPRHRLRGPLRTRLGPV
jgi:hypothetical protein